MNLKNFIIKKSITKLASLSFIVLIIFIAYSQYDTKTFSLGFKRIQNLLGRMYPVDFSILPELKQPIIETINIALFSSVLALCTTLILLPILTNVLFKLKIIPKIFSAVFSIFRTMPFLIIAAILVSLFSTGVFSGFVSIYLINILTSAKLLKEYAEEVEIKQLEAMESLGASKFIIYKNAILSNLKPQVISVYFLTLESSIRGASVLGLVGAGGIGQRLWQELNHLRYDRVSIIIITLVILIFVIDLVSYYFRNLQNTSQLNFEKFLLRRNVVKFGIPLIIVGSILYVTNFINISHERFIIGLKQLNVLAKGIINPDLAYVPKMLSELFVSIEIALSATIFAAVTAIFTSYLSSVNLFGKYKALGVKVFINILRTFPPIIVALIFFRGFGPGAISSFFALYIYTVGVMTKMYNEVLEGINNNVLLMTKSLGLGSFISYVKIIFNGYFPEFVTIVLYRFESNIKNSTILGMVGAGGIGHLLVNNIEYRNWNRISTLLIGLSLSIIIIENISYFIRMRVKK
ncbi:phosphonate ABC transporter, permease protein PhnE [Gemella haemolysans]|uniref:Phosphonate ABC transporter, permease protein PhnE n=1 Tax=Gemella haemolysans TaxID=1379 RepID=A0A134A085_9BACL|nr:ABC transporter permease subunit [Gemella haemolysans]KXB61092.1 phosphonate ABC transporter, permease protein PhnE [Gemella haemolysans]